MFRSFKSRRPKDWSKSYQTKIAICKLRATFNTLSTQNVKKLHLWNLTVSLGMEFLQQHIYRLVGRMRSLASGDRVRYLNDRLIFMQHINRCRSMQRIPLHIKRRRKEFEAPGSGVTWPSYQLSRKSVTGFDKVNSAMFYSVIVSQIHTKSWTDNRNNICRYRGISYTGFKLVAHISLNYRSSNGRHQLCTTL